MSGLPHGDQISPTRDLASNPDDARSTHAREAASVSRDRTGSSSRTGPTSFSSILNPPEGDWTAARAFGAARNEECSTTMTQNGSGLEGAAGTGLYTTQNQQLPDSSRSFEPFMTRATLDILTSIDTAYAARTDPVPGLAGSSNGSSASNSYTFPRPSYLEGSHYLARLEQQTRQSAYTQRESNGVGALGTVAANGNGGSHHHGPGGAAGSVGKPTGNPSYLGISRDVVERTPAHEFGGSEEDSLVDPLPTRWATAKEDRAAGLEVSSEGLEVKYTGSRSASERDHEACAIRADKPMPLQCGLYYFEVTILSRKHTDTTIAIGFSSKSVSLNRAPGWEPESWGFHGDDGHIFASQNVGKHYEKPFSGGDTIGCGVNFRTQSAFFTKNGKCLGPAFKEVKGKLYPSVGMKKPGEHIRVNFGQTPFIFDIDTLMKSSSWWATRQQPEARPYSAPTPSGRRVHFDREPRLSPWSPESINDYCDSHSPGSPNAEDLTPWGQASPSSHAQGSLAYHPWPFATFLSNMTGPYWANRGWAEIQRLEEEISKADTSRLAPPLNETEMIQQLVLQFLQHDGYVETARAFASEIQSEKQSLCLDPNVEIPGIDIRDDEDANNRQRIRRAILEGDIDRALKHTNAFYPQVLRENEHVFFRLKCRKFIEMIRREAEINLVGGDKRSHNNGLAKASLMDEDMEVDDDPDDFDGQMDSSGASRDLTQVALLYGQSLQADYAGDERREVRSALEEIFSLMAYQNPLKEPKVAHLLERKGRVAVAEELNSAILQSLGKSSRAALENVYAQTSVLLDDLAETGGPGAFVTLKGIMDEIEYNSHET